MKFIKNRSGFSLLELVVYLAIFSGIAIFMGNTFISIAKGGAKADARYSVHSNMNYALERIRQDVGDASNFSLSNGVAANALSLTVGGDNITYSASGGSLLRQVNSGTAVKVTSENVSIKGITFRLLQNINLPVQKITYSISTDINMAYNSTSPDYAFSEDTSRTAVLASFFDPPPRGSFGSPGGGDGCGSCGCNVTQISCTCTSFNELDHGNWFVKLFLKNAYALQYLPQGVTCAFANQLN